VREGIGRGGYRERREEENGEEGYKCVCMPTLIQLACHRWNRYREIPGRGQNDSLR
jgi:hypothetical protein